MAKKKKSEPIPIHIWIGIIFVLFIVVGSIVNSWNKSSTSGNTNYESNNYSPENDNQDYDNSGITYHITQDTYAATCEECFDEMFDYFKVNDEEAIQTMISEGRLKMLYEGEQLYLVDGGFTHAVLREKGSTEKLWVVNEHIKKD